MATKDEVFRFMNLRPVQKAANNRIDRYFACYDPVKKTSLQVSIEALTGADCHKRSLELAAAQLATSQPSGGPANLAEAVKKAAAADNVVQAKEIIQSETSMDVAGLLNDNEVMSVREWHWNMLYAHSLLPEVDPEKREDINDGVRYFHFLYLLTQQTPGDTPMREDDFKNIKPLIPKTLFRDPEIPGTGDESAMINHYRDQWQSILQKISQLSDAVTEIKNADRLFRSKQPAKVNENVTSKQAPVQNIADLAKNVLPKKEAAKLTATDLKKISLKKIGMTSLGREQTKSWLYSGYSDKNLTAATRNLMNSVKKDNEEVNVGKVMGDLQMQQYSLVLDFAAGLPKAMNGHLDKLEGFQDSVAKLAIPDLKFKVPGFFIPIPGKDTPSGRGIKPLGIGDLLVVKQELIKYESGEVAHIENVLKSEFKTRTFTRITQQVTETETVTESEQTNEKDTQSTERFELSTEVQKKIDEDIKVAAGVNVTGDFGPVKLTAHADFAWNRSKSESDRTASNYAKEVTNKAVSRITQRVREARKTQTLERIKDKDEHGFDNKAGSGHVIGIYRWVDKYYKARIINYGKRLMLEFIVPEPAAFYIRNQQEQSVAGVDAVKPNEPTIGGKILNPAMLSKSNYMDFVAEYNVPDAEPFPEDYVSISMSAGETAASGSNADFAKTYNDWVVPEGYEVDDWYGLAVTQGYEGYYANYLMGGVDFNGSLKGIEGIIPISVSGFMSAFEINVVAICRPTDKAVATWQLKAYQAIMNGYNQQLANYNAKVAAAQVQQGVTIEGRNPDINRKIEGDELRKGVLRLLTNNFAKIRLDGQWRYNEKFESMKDSGDYGYPEFNIDEAIIDGKIIQFFEQAIDWVNMTYYFYPYFWGRKSKWDELFPQNDTDPLFTQFLKSGAARVIIPVQQEYTEVMLHYLGTNEIWNGGDPPTLNDDLFISIVDEIKAENGYTPDDELTACSVDSGYPCVVDEWIVKLPTDLVYLQPDSELPDYTK